MGRRAVAIAIMLLSVVLSHSVLSHFSAPPASIERIGERSEAEAVEEAELEPLDSGGPAPAQETEQLGTPAMGQQLTAPASAQLDKCVAAAIEPPIDASHAQLARDSYTRSVQETPSPVALSIIRC